jgi:hypothetical protein
MGRLNDISRKGKNIMHGLSTYTNLNEKKHIKPKLWHNMGKGKNMMGEPQLDSLGTSDRKVR